MRSTTITLAAVLVAGTVTACGSGSGLTINLYVSPENNLQHVVDTCNAAAAYRYRIEYHKLPRSADGQREQMVQPARRGRPVPGRARP